jgi:hypothetical protein
MDVQRVLRDMRELSRAMVDPDFAPTSDEQDSYELTASARDFSTTTRRVVDEKLTFSAALMRAGEVHEANKVLAEVEHDVRNEEAVLLEKMNEVTARRAVQRAHMTRMRLVRLLATAMIGAGLLGVSAMGMALAGMFEEGKPRGANHQRRDAQLADARKAPFAKKNWKLGEVALKLSKQDLQTLRRLITGSVDASELQHFLAGDLDLPPGVVDETIATVLAMANPVTTQVQEVQATATPLVDAATDAVEVEKKKAEKATEKAAEQPSQQPAQPADEPTEEPKPSEPPADDEEDKGDKGDGEGRDGDGGQSPLSGLNGV